MFRIILALYACLGLTQASIAGGGGSQQTLPSHFAPKDLAAFSKKVEKALAEKRALVAIVARNGRPLGELPNGVRYTHVGFAVYSEIVLAVGQSQRGYAMHNLYQSVQHPNQSELVLDYPPDFFSGVYELKAGIIIPKPELQRKLYKAITDSRYENLHNARYSAIAHPFDTRYQNCTEFVLNVTQSALYETNDLAQIKQNLQKWFDPFVLPINAPTMHLAAMASSEIAIEDQRYPYKTATFGSIVSYMQQYNLATDVFEIQDLDAKRLDINWMSSGKSIWDTGTSVVQER